MRVVLSGSIACLCLAFSGAGSTAVSPNFVDRMVAGGPHYPTAMALAPDGRIFVSEQGGTLRVIKHGVVLSEPFVSLSVDSTAERGLLGITFDPHFSQDHYVYVYYTV